MGIGKIKKIIIILGVLCFLVLTACKGRDTQNEDSEINPFLYGFDKSVWDFSFQNGPVIPWYSQIVGEDIYLETEGEQSRSIYRLPFWCVKAGIDESSIVASEDFLSEYHASENGFSYIKYVGDNGYLCNSTPGIEDIEINVSDAEYFPIKVIEIDNGINLILSKRYLISIDKDGSRSNSIEVNGRRFDSIKRLQNGDCFVSYYDSNDSLKVGKLDSKDLRIDEMGALDFDVSNLCQYADHYLTIKGNNIVLLDKNLKIIESVYNFTEHNLVQGQAVSLGVVDGKIYVLFLLDSETGNIRLVELTSRKEASHNEEQQLYDEDGKRIVTLYSSMTKKEVEDFWQREIDRFNIEDKDYSVKIVESDSVFDTNFISENKPDIFFENMPYKIETYMRRGYFEDLSDYLHNTNWGSKGELLNLESEVYSLEGKQFALFNYVSPTTILVRESEGLTGGWSVDEFLDWISKKDIIYGTEGINRFSVLSICLNGNMNNYINLSNGEVNREALSDLLLKIKSLDISETNSLLLSDDNSEILLRENVGLLITEGLNIDSIASKESTYNEKLVNIGFPNCQKIKKSVAYPLFNIAVFVNSENKEGAFRFIDWCFSNSSGLFTNSSENGYTMGICYAVNSLREAEFNGSLGQRTSYRIENGETVLHSYSVTDYEKKLMEEITSNMEYHNEAWVTVSNMIVNESAYYFNDAVSLEEMVNVLISRIQLYLEEVK